MDKQNFFEDFMEMLKLKLIAKYDELGLRASGKYAEELEAEITETNLRMWGAIHSTYMENGRDAGPSDYRKIAPFMLQWIEVKDGLPSIFYEKKHSMAFAIAHKVANEGITVPNEFNKGEVISAVVNDFLANDIIILLDFLGEEMTGPITSGIIQLFDELIPAA